MSNHLPLPFRQLAQGGAGGGGALFASRQVLMLGDSLIAGIGTNEAMGVSLRGSFRQSMNALRKPTTYTGRNGGGTPYGPPTIAHEGYAGLVMGPNTTTPGFSIREALGDVVANSPNPGLIVVSIGGNDVLGNGGDVDGAAFAATTAVAGFQEIRAAYGAIPIIWLVCPFPLFISGPQANNLATAVNNVATAGIAGLTIVDGRGLLLGDTAGNYQADGLHWTVKGSNIVGPVVAQVT